MPEEDRAMEKREMSEQDPTRTALETAIEEALQELPPSPTLGQFGIARDDCALVHIDYFAGIEGATHALAAALAEARGTTAAAIFEEFGRKSRPCDCQSCVGPEAAAAARDKYRAAYAHVKEWGTPAA
jgi:hypothetical protein